MAGQGNDMPNSAGADAGAQDVCSSFFAMLLDQRQSMERLLNWLRESQTTCTDTICSDDPEDFTGYQDPLSLDNRGESASLDGHPITLVLGLVMAILTIYFMNLTRNRASRSKSNQFDGTPPSGGGNDTSPAV